MIDRLRARLPDATDDEISVISNIIETYDIAPNIKNFDHLGFRFFDNKQRIVRVVEAQWREQALHVLTDPAAEIVIIHAGGIVAGWIEASKLENAGDRLIAYPKSLNQMPLNFSFDQECPHMIMHGGFYEGEYWECGKCGKRLIFNDKK